MLIHSGFELFVHDFRVSAPAQCWSRHVGEIRIVADSAFRRRGLRHALAQTIFDLAKNSGVEKLTAETVADEPGPIHIFERIGFRTEATLNESSWPQARPGNGAPHGLAVRRSGIPLQKTSFVAARQPSRVSWRVHLCVWRNDAIPPHKSKQSCNIKLVRRSVSLPNARRLRQPFRAVRILWLASTCYIDSLVDHPSLHSNEFRLRSRFRRQLKSNLRIFT